MSTASPAIAAGNNLCQGFRSLSVLLPGDDPAEYAALHAELTRHFTPADLTELRCVREMADAEWRLRRLRRYAEESLTRRIAALAPDHPDADPVSLQRLALDTLGPATGTSYSAWLRYENKFELQYERAHRAWCRYQQSSRLVSEKEADIWLKQALFSPLPHAAPAAARPAGVHPATQFRALESKAATAACPAPVVFPERMPSARPNATPAPVVPDLEPAFVPDDEESDLPPATPARDPRSTAVASNVQNHATSLQTPRNAPCPCGSREKFKRCCGKSAPPVLCQAA